MPTNPTDNLKKAIQKLDAFSRQAEKERAKTPLQKTIALIRTKIAGAFADKTLAVTNLSAVPENSADILQAVEVVTRKRLLIEKLKTGSPTERSLAESFARSIAAYNGMRERCLAQSQQPKTHLPTSFFKNTTAALFSHLPKIDLPQSAVIKCHFPPIPQAECSKQQILSLNERATSTDAALVQTSLPAGPPPPLAAPLSQQSAELFQMKALALLERYGIASNPEARTLVKQSPIFTTSMPGSPKCTLSQTLALFPGQTVVVMGNTELDPTTKTISRLFPETFSISLESMQTGFPHACQRAGWSLANELLPDFPQRLDMLPTLGAFYRAKKQAAIDLLPQGSRLDKAKKLLKLKRQLFNAHKSQFIELHRQLAQAIVRAYHKNNAAPLPIIDAYFDELACLACPFDVLAATAQQVQELFVATPYRRLLDTSLQADGLGPTRITYASAKQTLKKALCSAQSQVDAYQQEAISISEQRKWTYVALMGTLFGTSAQAIMLQYLSEDLVFAPPVLNAFELKVQTAAYHHVEDFLQELYADTMQDIKNEENAIYAHLKAQIEWDITLFNQGQAHTAAAELAAYFDRRHQQKG